MVQLLKDEPLKRWPSSQPKHIHEREKYLSHDDGDQTAVGSAVYRGRKPSKARGDA